MDGVKPCHVHNNTAGILSLIAIGATKSTCDKTTLKA
ncbi:Uncharacterised protein [Mycobacteroides abscessus subsp. bolletii]|nr:Uncharacterised protein [Mycobacteroides abscessus subsp. bolletii]SHY55067.1 Uncharacterised protein [Mycobacteroides abscessus subsp. bolletii]SKD57707.1 Uncharacterised protein [Mycobacteroides abscessus subsp. bolletii]SKE55504.1 Uncharacterised protein [Mycobacteroides abscessus subsp. bolletii]SKI08395.1 Uncharacterised protein [Mycobacteroides abscessus subsp. bolletii]